MEVLTIPAFSDNYIWLITGNTKQAIVVDPGDATPVLKVLKEKNLELKAILITHFHADHTGGIQHLLNQYPGISVYGPATENIQGVTHRVSEGDSLSFPELNISFDVLDVFGHTAGHVAYYSGDKLFCGDTLFACGCGRVFNGTAKALAASLKKISALPESTLLYCAHEYTLDNIGFARWVEPENADLLKREQETHQLLSEDKASVPSLLSLELATNPFVRLNEPTVIAKAESFSGKTNLTYTEVFTAIRQWKDTEYD